jgi:hypothetical protein
MASTTIPVEKPTGVPLEPLFYQDTVKTPVDYLIDQLDGQKVRSIFA